MATAPTQPSNRVTTPQATERADEQLPLTPDVAAVFVREANARLASPDTIALLGEQRELYAASITEEPTFPFRATVQHGAVTISYAPDKVAAPMLKSLSDGVTMSYKRFVATSRTLESQKFALSMIFQPAIYEAYLAAGLDTGAHTRYIFRCC